MNVQDVEPPLVLDTLWTSHWFVTRRAAMFCAKPPPTAVVVFGDYLVTKSVIQNYVATESCKSSQMRVEASRC